MSLKLGDIDINKLYLGSTEIKQAYLGDVEVFREGAEYSFLQATVNTGSSTTYNFTSQDLGDAADDRLIVVGVSGYRDAGGTVNSATIGGVSATIHQSQGAARGSLTWLSAVVPSGTSGTISVTFSVLQAGCIISTYRVVGYESATPEFTLYDDTSPMSLSPSFTEETVVLAHATANTTSGGFTWGGTIGVSEDSDVVGDNKYSTASIQTGTDGTITVTPPSTNSNRMQVIGFR